MKPNVCPYVLPMSRVCHNHSFELLIPRHCEIKTKAMSHNTISFYLIKIQSEFDQNYDTL